MRFEKLKRSFLQVLIVCLVAAATLAVIAVLAGGFSDVLGRSLLTILIVAIHAGFGFGFVVGSERQKKKENLEIFTNAFFSILVLSFITAIFGIWGLAHGSVILKLYLTYFVLLFAILHGEILAQTLGEESSLDNIVFANYLFMTIVVLMLLMVIFLRDTAQFPSLFYRVLAAAGIIDATLTLVAIILHKLYLQKHPKINDAVFALQPKVPGQAQPLQAGQPMPAQPAPSPHRGISALLVILIIFLALQFVGAIAVAIIGRFGGR